MEHVNLINRIIEAETKARQIADEASEKRRTLQQDLSDAKASLRQSYFDRASRRIADVRAREDALTDETIGELSKVQATRTAEMEAKFAANREEWVEKLFSMIVGR